MLSLSIQYLKSLVKLELDGAPYPAEITLMYKSPTQTYLSKLSLDDTDDRVGYYPHHLQDYAVDPISVEIPVKDIIVELPLTSEGEQWVNITNRATPEIPPVPCPCGGGHK